VSARSGPDDRSFEPPSSLLQVLEDARDQDLLGPMPLQEQVDHALGFAHALEQLPLASPSVPGAWLDLGSGGGLPGLVLAQYWPESQAVLLDAAQRRTAFLTEAVHRLGWDERVRVLRARAEEAALDPQLRRGFGVVWARSFGSPPVTAECAAPFLMVGGLLVVSEPPRPTSSSEIQFQSSDRWPREGLAQLGQEPLAAVRARFGYEVIRQVDPCPDRFPRRSGVASKRPLYRVPEA
jgi:16S rRNA (guanine527-N7)-methyltransferase